MAAILARQGALESIKDVADLTRDGAGFLKGAEIIVDSLYCGINTAVSMAQGYVGYRMLKSLVKNWQNPQFSRPFEAGIDVPVESLPRTNAYPPFEVGIEHAPPLRQLLLDDPETIILN